jgi:hypothetical protein
MKVLNLLPVNKEFLRSMKEASSET